MLREFPMSDYLTRTMDENARKTRRMAMCSAAVLLAGIAAVLITPTFGLFAVVFSIAGAVGLAIRASAAKARNKILAIGIEGETETRNALRACLARETTADGFVVFYNVPIGHGDIDQVIVGPTGIFCVEIKHHRGFITWTGKECIQEKVGVGGTRYRGSLKRPEAQLFGSVRALKAYLGSRNVNVWLAPLLIFSNKDAVIDVKGGTRNGLKVATLEDLPEILLKSGPVLKKEIRDKIEAAILELSPAQMTVQEAFPRAA
jgi:hypothetical protein